MPESSTMALFVSVTFTMQMMPGPATIYIATRSLEQGTAAGLVSALGIVIGVIFHVLAATLGLSAVLMASATAFTVMKYVGAAYLIYLGIKTLRQSEAVGFSDRSASASATLPPPTSRSLLDLGCQGVLVNVFNPKAAVFFLAFLPQFVTIENGPAWSQSLVLGIVFALLGLVTGGLYVLLAARLQAGFQRYRSFRQTSRYVSGGTYIALGLVTATSDRP